MSNRKPLSLTFTVYEAEAMWAGKKTRHYLPLTRPTIRPGKTRKATRWLPTIWAGLKAGDKVWVAEPIYLSKRRSALAQIQVAGFRGGIITQDLTLAGAGDKFYTRPNFDPAVAREEGMPWEPCMAGSMPKWASRMTLTITSAKSIPMWAISAPEMFEAGVYSIWRAQQADLPDGEIHGIFGTRETLKQFRSQWNSSAHSAKHGWKPWENNPRVLCLTYEVEKRPQERLGIGVEAIPTVQRVGGIDFVHDGGLAETYASRAYAEAENQREARILLGYNDETP